MATINVAGRFRAHRARHELSSMLRALWKAFLRRREERRAFAQISRLGPRLMRDIGLDPEQVYAELGGRHEVLPVNRRLLPKDTFVR